jgi:hypothetical protein
MRARGCASSRPAEAFERHYRSISAWATRPGLRPPTRCSTRSSRPAAPSSRRSHGPLPGGGRPQPGHRGRALAEELGCRLSLGGQPFAEGPERPGGPGAGCRRDAHPRDARLQDDAPALRRVCAVPRELSRIRTWFGPGQCENPATMGDTAARFDKSLLVAWVWGTLGSPSRLPTNGAATTGAPSGASSFLPAFSPQADG